MAVKRVARAVNVSFAKKDPLGLWRKSSEHSPKAPRAY